MKGKIIADYYPLCGLCGEVTCALAERTAILARATALKKGWSYTRLHGLICPTCHRSRAPVAAASATAARPG